MKTSKYIKTTLFLFWLVILMSCQDNSDFFLLEQKGGQEMLSAADLVDYRGKWLIINFWAEWCVPCLKEVPELNKLYWGREANNLEIIGVSFDPINNNKVREIAVKWGMQYPMIATNPVPILPFSLPRSLPGNYIINPNGELVATLRGEQNYDSISKLLITLKKQTSQSE